MKTNKYTFTFFFFLTFYSIYAQKSTCFFNATIHTGKGEVLENAWLKITKDTIESIGIGITDTSTTININCKTKHIYPGLILSNTSLGLREYDAVRSMCDDYEVGDLNPNVRSIVAYNTDSELTPTLRLNGICYGQITPSGNLLAGSSSVVKLDAWNWEDALVKADVGIHLFWPARSITQNWWEDKKPNKKNESRDKLISNLELFFDDARAYMKQQTPSNKNIRFEACRDLLTNKGTLYIHAEESKDIMEAVIFSLKYDIKKIVICGGLGIKPIIPFLKQHQIAVILTRAFTLPLHTDDSNESVWELPYELEKAGMLYAMSYAGDMEIMGARNLPFAAGSCVKYGLSKENALKMITYNPAKIMGVDSKIGSIEKGKKATLFISKGDILDIITNNVELMLIDGKPIELISKQTILYNKYLQHYGLNKTTK